MEQNMEKRLRIYPLLFIFAYIIAYTFKFLFSPETRLQKDFIVFYAAAEKISAGAVLEIYDIDTFQPFVEQTVGHLSGVSPWLYPPIFLLFIFPLVIFPYLPAMFAWLIVTLVGYITVVRKIAPHPDILKLALGFTATYINFDLGQNGFLTAFLLGMGLLLLERHRVGAGILLGLLTYKPHLALLIAVALTAGKMWKALAIFLITFLLLIIISAMLFGIESWQSFYYTIPLAQSLMDKGTFPLVLMPTVYAFARLLGAASPLAYKLQIFFSIGAILLVTWVWHRHIFPMAYIILTASIFFVTPYAMLYDLTIIGLSIAWYGWYGFQNGWLAGEKSVLILACLIPLFSQEIAIFTKIQIMPIILLAIIILAIRRLQHERI